jgi:hypothetical protein
MTLPLGQTQATPTFAASPPPRRARFFVVFARGLNPHIQGSHLPSRQTDDVKKHIATKGNFLKIKKLQYPTYFKTASRRLKWAHF